jgi:hypothetical protein
MKTIYTLLSFFFFTFTSIFAQAPLPGTVPDKLVTGKMQILEKLADAMTVTVECAAPGMKTFVQRVNIPKNFDSIDDITSVVESIQVKISTTDPTVEFELSASVADAIGDVQFRAINIFKLEKVYGKEGVSYQVPSWAGDLYFWLANQGIYFPDVQSASFIGKDFEFVLEVNNGWISAGYFGNGFLKVVTSSGTYYYDWNTGKRVSNNAFMSGPKVAFEDVHIIEDGNVYRTLYPEWNYVPWLEVKVPANGIVTLDVQSINDWQPSAVWMRSFHQVRTGTEPPPQQYTPGMILDLKPGSTVYFWFDFPDWVWGSGDSGGKG